MPATAVQGGVKPQVHPGRTKPTRRRMREAIRRMETTNAIIADASKNPAAYLDAFVVEGGGE